MPVSDVVPATTISRVHLPDPPGVALEGGGVTAHWYRPDGTGETPPERARVGIVVLPIQGGDYDVSRHFAAFFARRGFQVLRFERRADWLDPDRELSRVAELVDTFVGDVKRGIDHWLEQDAFDPQRLGLFGVSMGAVVGSAVAGTDRRVRASMLCLGGGDIAGILTRGRDKELDAFRRDYARRLGRDEAELEPLFREALGPVDNLPRARGMDRETTLMVASRFDRVVPWSHQTLLWRTIGEPRRHSLPCGHYSAVVFLPLIRTWGRRWFDRHLSKR